MDYKILKRAQINELIPQSPPFLYLNEITTYDEKSLSAKYFFDAHEPLFQGHFPGDPIVPGVLLCECCLQAGAVFLSLNNKAKIQGKAIVTKMDKVKFKNFVRPMDDLTINVTIIDKIEQYVLMQGKITSCDKLVMSLEFMVGTI